MIGNRFTLTKQPSRTIQWMICGAILGISYGPASADLLGTHQGVGGALSVSYAPNGKYVASGGADKLVKVWTVADKKLLVQLDGLAQTVSAVAYSVDGSMVVGGDIDGNIMLWSTSTWRMVWSAKAANGVLSVAFSPDGQTIATGEHSKLVSLWQATDGKRLKSLAGHTAEVTSVAFSTKAKIFASGSTDDTINVWDYSAGAANATLKGTLKEHKNDVTGVAFFSDGMLASTSLDKTVRLWDVTTLTAKGKGELPSDNSYLGFHSIAVSPDGKRVATGGNDSFAMVLWDRSGTSVKFRGYNAINADDTGGLAFSPNSVYIASASTDSTVKLVPSSQIGSTTYNGARTTSTSDEKSTSKQAGRGRFGATRKPDGVLIGDRKAGDTVETTETTRSIPTEVKSDARQRPGRRKPDGVLVGDRKAGETGEPSEAVRSIPVDVKPGSRQLPGRRKP